MIAPVCTFETTRVVGEVLVVLPLTKPAQPLMKTREQLRIAQAAAHTHAFMIVFTFVTFSGSASAR